MSRRIAPCAAAAFIAVCFLGYAVVDRFAPNALPTMFGAASVEAGTSPAETTAHFPMCSSNRFTCVVDGDTVWYKGQNLRLQAFDTPETHTQICGGASEVALGKKAAARLRQLLNSNAFTVETFGIDGTGHRRLATIRIGGRDVGDILIEEHLARHWPDGDEWWCR